MAKNKKISYPFRENAKLILLGGSLITIFGLLLSLSSINNNSLMVEFFSDFGMISGAILLGVGVVLYHIQELE